MVSCSAIMMTREEKCKKADKFLSMAALVENTNPQLAIKHTLDAIDLCPNGMKYAYLGILYKRLGNNEEANKNSEIALGMEPNNVFVLDRVAFLYYSSAKYNEAILLLGRALSIQPNDAFAREILATIYIIQRELKKGESELLKNILNNPNFALSYYTLGKLYMDELTDHEKAHEYLSKHLSLEKDHKAFSFMDAQKRLETLKNRMQILRKDKK